MLPELYHAHHNRHLEDLPFWLEFASQAGDPILELGCGTGRVLQPLAQAGYQCFGLDRDLEMLRYLAAHLDPSLAVKPILMAADISCFSLEILFPLIILPCNTYTTLNTGQRQNCLHHVRRHLAPGGSFVVSQPNPQAWRKLPARSEIEYEEEFILPKTGNPVQVSSGWQRSRHTFTISWVYDQLFPDGTVERVTMQAAHFQNSLETCRGEFQAAGLITANSFGDYDCTPYKPDSPYLILQATTPKY